MAIAPRRPKRWLKPFAFAIVELGVAPAEFWRLTPAELAAMVDAHKQRERRIDARYARVMSVLANCHRDPNKRARPFTETDFMPVERKRLDGPAVLASLKAYSAAYKQARLN